LREGGKLEGVLFLRKRDLLVRKKRAVKAQGCEAVGTKHGGRRKTCSRRDKILQRS